MKDIDWRLSITSVVVIAIGLFLLWFESAWLCNKLWSLALWLSMIAGWLGETLLRIVAALLGLLEGILEAARRITTVPEPVARFALLAFRTLVVIAGIALTALGACILWACFFAPVIRLLRHQKREQMP
jgi:hypothetical protein